MTDLNLPSYEVKLRRTDSKTEIFDLIRKKWIVLTPEEWVRQHFVNYLINVLQYPKTLIKIEAGLKYNTLSKRTDIVVYDRKALPFLLVECKAPHIKLSEKAATQIAVYNHKVEAPYLVITNGMTHLCYSMDVQNNTILNMNAFPSFPV